MAVTEIETLVVGGGQAGIAMSEHLTRSGIPHLVIEKNRIAERWRSGRWDSLVANGPAWHDRFPNRTFPGDPDGFVAKDDVAAYFEDYARQIDAPVHCGVEVLRASKRDGAPGYLVQTTQGSYAVQNIVAATGPFQTPVIPPILPEQAGITQMHSAAYRNPAALPKGGVLVVGAGSSGVQIAEELMEAGRRVHLSVGPHERPPRSYRGRDFCWWLGVLGKWDAAQMEPGREHVTIAVSGARGGKTVDFRALAARGMILVGRTEGFEDGKLCFAPDLAENVARGDASLHALLDEADAHVASNGLDLPPDPGARETLPDPECLTHPLRALDLAGEGISTVIWATGYASDYSWLEVDAFDDRGRPQHQRGISRAPGIYFLGLPWQSRRGSAFIWGVWHDAKLLADHMLTRRSYAAYHAQASRAAPAQA